MTNGGEGGMSDDRNRVLRAVLRNALTWGAAWAVAGGGIIGLLGLFNPNPAIESLPERVGLAVFYGAAWGVRFGIAGAVIGTLFAFAIRLGYRGRRLADIDPLGFTALGAVVGGAGVPLYLQAMNLVTGGTPLAWSLVSSDAVFGVVFGASAAGGAILLARRADALPGGSRAGLLGGDDDAGREAAAAPREVQARRR